MAAPDSGRVADCPFDVLSGGTQRLLDRMPEREVCRDSGGKCATSTMRVSAGQPRSAQLEVSAAADDQVDRFGSLAVAPLHHYDARAVREDSARGSTHVIRGSDRHLCEDLRFRDVRGHDSGVLQQLGPDRADRLSVEQSVAPFRNHHRIHDNVPEIEAFNCRRDGLDDRRVGQHPGLHRVHTHISLDCLDLRGHQIGGNRLPCRNAKGVLRGYRRDRRRAVHTMRRKGFQVRLDAGASTRVAARDCQCYTHKVEFELMTSRVDRLSSGALLQVFTPDLSPAIRTAAVLFVTTLTAVAAQVSIPLPFTPVPFTLQPMVVLLGGAALGSRLGLTSQVLYLAAGIAGLPVFAASPVLPQGMARLLGPTGGYLLSYPFAAFIVGYLAERGFDRRYLTSVAAMSVGLSIVFAFGVAWMAWGAPALGLNTSLRAGFYPFVPADIIKVFVAAAILPVAWKFLR
jgi:biotin transport system substrate-specific component